MTDRVLVTGMAWDTALGADLDTVWAALLAGASGIRPVPSSHKLRNSSAAVVDDLPLDGDHRARQQALGLRTLRAAIADAGLKLDDPRLQLVAGTSYGPDLDAPAESLAQWGEDLAAASGVPTVTLSTACSAGSDAVQVGAALVADGTTDICVVGGVDILTPAKRLGHSALGTMSPTTLRAFDSARDGMLLGEGAAFLVLESTASASARSARVYGAVTGAGSANDAHGATAPDPSGDTVVRAIETALRMAGRDASEVAVLNAHGSGTPVNDDVEAQSFRRLFSSGPVVFATKGAFGHTLGATGALEAVAVLLALRDQRAPAVVGLTDPLPDFPLRLPVGEPMAFSGSVGLSVTLGFGGFNTCLVLERP
ncbi:beta-ketoacyl-[acyl-carrier-protein] synthase family protein [Kribbella antibiotica]|uniref:Beta-ketoacyl-[acyl-carrier-protein] synthase family protein n=1 Tax=Kribbella antibiotica TaxID=190195 RepID=A0A4R4ZTX4_9ACTN|nr:beta-ketoacyl synthase N-terminal-like domain-containing protein [Kribbella antibiotica]TDD61594.1 beta-ketoacyl-[acyl-carrier-protein] synthase family protein [Kribbella antibiotica]